MRDAAKIYHCSPSSVSNHVKSKENSTKQPIMHHADADVDRQLLTPGEEAALERHIYRCYGSGFEPCGGLWPIATGSVSDHAGSLWRR